MDVNGRGPQRGELPEPGTAARSPLADAGLAAAVKPDMSVARDPVRPAPPSPSVNAHGPLLSATHPGASHAPAAGAAHLDYLAQPFGTPAWDDGLSARVVWMAKNDVQSAAIRLNPEDLGPIEIKLTLTSDPEGSRSSAAVQFSALNASTREAIEAALPKLREMLQASGIALGQASVDAGTAGNGNAFADPGRQFSGTPRTTAQSGREDALETTSTPPTRRGNALVDTFA